MISSNKKILINCLSARSGGATSYLRNAVSRILDQGNCEHGVEFHALCDASQAQQIDAEPDRIISANTEDLGVLQRSLWEKRNLPRIVREQGFNTVFTPYQVSSATIPARSVLMLRNMEPFYFHRYQYSPKTRLRNHMLRWSTIRSTKTADQVIAVSDFARNCLVNNVKVPARNVTRIYHGRDPYFSDRADDQSVELLLAELHVQRPFLLTCGSLLPYRRCEDVIRAFLRFCADDRRRMQLVIAGDGNDPRYKNKLQQMSNQSKLADRIRFTGHVSKCHIRGLYQQAELVILATEIEACPNIAIETMSSGAAILASDSDPLPEIIGRDNARFFERRNTDQLSGNMRRLLNSPKTIAEFRQRARRRADDYSWQSCSTETVQLLVQF